jgi:DNA-3-methyladenine glycosylase
MWGPAGCAYVFLVYGLHHQFNVVTTGRGKPHAVLVRALEPLDGARLMALRRGQSEDSLSLTNGPGKLCEALSIDLSHNGTRLTGGSLYLAEGGSAAVERSPRIGIDYAGEWKEKPWRFSEKGNRYVSRRPRRA